MDNELMLDCLNSSRKYIEQDLKDLSVRFIKLGFHFYEVQRLKYYEAGGYSDVAEFAEAEFGIKRSTCYNYILLCQVFSRDGHSMFLDDKYKDYSYSQLVEMLSICHDSNKLKYITSSSTIREIRDIKKYGYPVDVDIQKKDLKCFLDVIDYSGTRQEFINLLKKHCSTHYGGCRSEIMFDFSPAGISINKYTYTVKSLLDCLEKYNLIKFEEEQIGNIVDIPESSVVVVQTSGLDETSATFQETFDSSNEVSLEDTLMEILKTHIKNVDKVASLIEFMNEMFSL